MKMKKVIYTIAISIFAALLLLLGCDSWKTNLKADIDQESKDYCLFAPGSYWVYRDSATLETDKVVVEDVSYEKSTLANPKISFLWEEYTMRLKYYKNDTDYNGSYILTSKYCDDDLVEAGIIKFCLLFASGGKYHNGEIGECSDYPILLLLERRNNYISNKVTYSNIKIFENSSSDLGIKKIIYWAKHIGLIREEIFVNDNLVSVRNLIKYNVKPYNQ
jgi:hypothetical protein